MTEIKMSLRSSLSVYLAVSINRKFAEKKKRRKKKQNFAIGV